MSERPSRGIPWATLAVGGVLLVIGLAGLVVRGEPAGEGGGPTAGVAEPDPHAHEDAPRAFRPVRGEGSAAGGPLAVARRFGEAWVNQPSGGAAARAHAQRLVGLASGSWARELADGYRIAIRDGWAYGGSEGRVVAVEPLRERRRSVEALVITQERITAAGEAEPYRYAVYVVRLGPGKGGYVVVDWEPQR